MSDEDPSQQGFFQGTQTIHLDGGFAKDVTTTGSFDIRGDIWASTFGKVVQAMPVPVLLIDEYRNVIVANEACSTISNDYEEILDAPFSRLFPEITAAEEAQTLLAEVFSTRKPQVAEGNLQLGKDRIWGRMTYRPIRIMDLRLVLLVVENLTREKQQILENKRLRAELEERVEQRTVDLRESNRKLQLAIEGHWQATEALARSEDLLQQVFNSMSSGVIVLDRQGDILLTNRSALSLLRLEDDITGQAFNDVLPSMDILMNDASSQYQAEAVTTLQDGTRRLFGYTSNSGGAEGGRVVLFRDITEMVESEERRRRAEQLALVGEMISRLNHEIRNPLASIVVGVKTLQRDTLESSAHGNILRLVSDELDSLTKIVNQLLESACHKTPYPRPVYVEHLLERCLDANGLIAVRRGITLKLVRFPSSSVVIVDDQAMLRVLDSLVQNALDAASKGDLIRIGWRELDEVGRDELVPGFPGKVVSLFVEDTGAGIPSEISASQSRIFKAFVSTKASGSGLGLAVSRDIAEAHGGLILVSSPDNLGTKVEILLPSPEAIPCWDWHRDRNVARQPLQDADCDACDMRSTGNGYCCWTRKGRAYHAETGQWPDRCLTCGFFRSSSLTPFFRSRLVV